ncbi:MAG: hypothetical protein COT73_09245 [Bdellovibrio sp. CG10_big_fil_rev_8_21_14_0_10_47_8]|nr:MAG: hypothetical protein COT73_09245 [Bdellovibrio sp. CG10_big_fil_rev_8_21_14_0_10_47_8]
MQTWAHLSFRSKLILSFLFVASGAIISGYIQFSALTRLTRAAQHVSEVNLVGLTNLSKMDSSIKTAQMKFNEIKTSGHNPNLLEEPALYLDEALSDFSKFQALYTSGEMTETEIQLIDKLSSTFEPLSAHLSEMTKVILNDIKAAPAVLATLNQSNIDDEFKKVADVMGDLKSFQNDAGFQWSTSIKEDSQRAKSYSILAISFFFVVSIAFGIFLSAVLSKRLISAAEKTSRSVGIFGVASSEIYETSIQLSEKVTHQASALQESVAALTEISAMVEKVVEESQHSHLESVESEQQAESGKQSVDEVLQSFHDVHQSTEQLIKEIQSNNEKTAEILQTISTISAKTQVINEIVFQTKLLSFNASVEAARAGEHGKGFSVVAEEVGQLAQMSGQASKEINQILTESYTRVQTILKESQESSERWTNEAKAKLNLGLQRGAHSKEALEKILASASNVTGRIQLINTAIGEQQKGITEIQKVMNELEKVSSFNSVTAEKTRTIAENITKESQIVESAVEDLEVTLHGHKTKHSEKKAA